MGSLNYELRRQFQNFASASGRDPRTLIGISPRVAQSDDREILDVWRCKHSLNCKKTGQFENFASASGRDITGLASISPWVALSVVNWWIRGWLAGWLLDV